MKKLLLGFTFFTLFLTLNVSYAHNNPVIDSDLFTIESINFEMSYKLVNDYGMEITFNEGSGNLEISLNEEVSFLRITNAGEALEFQLPIFSKSVILDLDDFDLGDYKMHILLKNEAVLPAKFSK